MITIVIPTINEEKNISKTLKKISGTKDLNKVQIIVVDDNSLDNTATVVNNFKNKIDVRLIKNNKKLGLSFQM